MKNEWKRDRKVLEMSDVSSTDENTDSDHPLKTKSSTDESYSLKNSSSVDKKILKKYGLVNKIFVKGEDNSSETNESKNRNHSSDKKLKKKLDVGECKSEETKKKRGNRNGKIGVNKHTNYTPNASAPRKTCSRCGSVNHLSANCKTVIAPNLSMPMSMPYVSNMHLSAMNMMPGLLPHNPYSQSSMPYMFNPYFNAFNMPQFHSNLHGINSVCMPQMPVINSNVDIPISQSKPKIEPSKSKGKVEIEGKAVRTKKSRPKAIWVPKST